MFVGRTVDKASWVEVGRCFERFALQATALGIGNALLSEPARQGQPLVARHVLQGRFEHRARCARHLLQIRVQRRVDVEAAVCTAADTCAKRRWPRLHHLMVQTRQSHRSRRPQVRSDLRPPKGLV